MHNNISNIIILLHARTYVKMYKNKTHLEQKVVANKSHPYEIANSVRTISYLPIFINQSGPTSITPHPYPHDFEIVAGTHIYIFSV